MRLSAGKTAITSCIVIAVIGAAVLLQRGSVRATAETAGKTAPAVVVSASQVLWSDWPSGINVTCNIHALKGADLAAEVSGIVDEINFASGEAVPAGKALLRLRLNDEPALLQEREAQAQLAAIKFARDQKEFSFNAISAAALDTDRNALAAAKAEVAAEQSLIERKTVKAPFDGRLGIRQVNLGEYLTTGSVIVTLQSTDPIAADFYVPEQFYGALHLGQSVQLRVDAYPGRSFVAAITAITPKIDEATRTVTVRATLANPDGALAPGMFAKARLIFGDARRILTVPQSAISFAPYGSSVFVLEGSEGTMLARSLSVRTGEARGDRIEILSGLTAGQTVVTAGQLKLRDGLAVAVDNRIAPDEGLDPNPPEE